MGIHKFNSLLNARSRSPRKFLKYNNLFFESNGQGNETKVIVVFMLTVDVLIKVNGTVSYNLLVPKL